MKFPKLFYTLIDVSTINKTMLDDIYHFTTKIVLILMLSVLALAWMLYPEIKSTIIYWTIVMYSVLLFRLYTAYRYKHHRNDFTYKQWYIIYYIFAFLVAFLYASLCIFVVPYVNLPVQMAISIVLVGLSSGSITAFPTNYRLGIVYLLMVMIPLIWSILFISYEGRYMLIVIILLYVVGTIGMIFRNYKHELEFKFLQTEHKHLNHLLKEAPLGIFIYDTDLIVKECNEHFLHMFDNTREEMLGLDLKKIPDNKATSALKKALEMQSQSYNGPYISTKGKMFWIEAKIFPYKNKWNETVGSIVLIEDKSKEKRTQDDLKHLVSHDALTGLLNRRGLRDTMKTIMSDALHHAHYSLLFYLDLNQFKGINDSLGHTIGDAVLLNVSQRLKYSLDDECRISRLGGDEFIVIVPYVSDDESATKKIAEKYANRIQSIFDDPFIIEDLHLHIQASMGIIIMEPQYNNIEEIIRHADITMYHAKNTNGHISYYNEALDQEQKELFVLQHDLAYAVDKHQFDLFFQPIVTIKDEKLYSAEALIRWNHPEKGLLSPDAFIPLAIKAGLLSKITWWVLHEVCRHISEWKKFDLWHLEYVSINVNAQQLIENNFAETFLDILKSYGLETKDIIVEITERSLIDNFDSTQDVINQLRGHGIRCAIDDFGVGYSSLSYLKKLSFHTLKIDREFIKDIESNPKELLLVSTILDIGRQFNYNIVIEGVEDKKQKDLLLGLDEGLSYQGFYFSKPLHAEVFREKFLY